MSEQPTVQEIVLNDERYQKIIQELLEKRFLMPGIFHPLAYLRDTDKIKQAWKRKKTTLNAIAMGVSLHNDFFQEVINCKLNGEDPTPMPQTKKALDTWEAEVGRLFESEFKDIEETCRTLGQYLEFMNRKSQGF
ncbi:MAG: hypothetical protein A2283_22055 [Lentisphaerae bacterium RIFOXYA12_FULL_48_11]|nr:MAG: hypothetical protein A2283_22055 [Lentisphaerae bacterium RIFOXYA12_FULL_48_11]